MDDFLEDAKWESLLDQSTIQDYPHHYLRDYAYDYAEDQSCSVEELSSANNQKNSPQKLCHQKCCPAASSLSYRFKKTVIEEEEYNHNYCEKGMHFLKGKRFKMTTFEDVPKMSRVDLFGLVGGYLGLFVGISLVTLFEFFEFGIIWCFGGQKK